MNEFDGKKFYGFSHHNDPALSTTTRNFEFKYARSELLERAIQMVQHNETENDRHGRTDALDRLCNANKVSAAYDVNSTYQRDSDIETHVSRLDSDGRGRTLSNTAINQLIGKVRSYGHVSTKNLNGTYPQTKNLENMTPPSILTNILRSGGTNDQPRHGSLNTQLNYTANAGERLSCEVDPTSSEDQILCNPFELPHEPLFEITQNTYVECDLNGGVNQLPKVLDEDESKTVMPVIIEEFWQPHPKWVEICEMPAKARLEVNEMKIPLDTTQNGTISQQLINPKQLLPANVADRKHSHELPLPPQISAPEMMADLPPPSPCLPNLAFTACSTYHGADSDLEYELINRPIYTKFCGPRASAEEYGNNKNGRLTQFLEMEPTVSSMNFLKNVSPIRYSDIPDEREEDTKQPVKVVIKSHLEKHPPPLHKNYQAQTINDIKSGKNKITKKKKVEKVKPSPQKLSARTADTEPSTTEKYLHTPRTHGRMSAPTMPRNQKHLRPCQTNNVRRNELSLIKNIVLTKSIEDLKIEKMAIFAKIRSFQERIIESLDKLRISLLELHVPDSHYEKIRRQKNAFEFSVRFSRNFLYPLKGMIEDLRLVSVEQLHSASPNDATQRLLNIFVLIQQSLQTYHKQLRFFLLDQMPQKLKTLVELAISAINICWNKQIFDRNDAIIGCMQIRCTKFLGFLENINDERFLSARDNYRKAFDKPSSNYSLKMFMNDLNMYEPKLVAKNHYKPQRKPKQRRVPKPSSTSTKKEATLVIPKTSEMIIAKPDGDQISTHVNILATSSEVFHHGTNTNIKPSAGQSMNSEESQNLNEALIEALQTVTKEQMRQVLQPFTRTLNLVLEKKTSYTIEELLNDLKKKLISLAEGEQMYKIKSNNSHKMHEESKAVEKTERQNSRHLQSNIIGSTKSVNNPVNAFFGSHTAASGTAICDDDNDVNGNNYYDEDEFEQSIDSADELYNAGADTDNVNDGAEWDFNVKVKNPTTDLTESTYPTDRTEYNNRKCNNYKSFAIENHENSERGLDFVSFERNSNQFDAVISMKPENNRTNEQRQKRKQQSQVNREQVKYLQLQRLRQQQQEQQHPSAIREWAASFDTPIQQRQQILRQQTYPEQCQLNEDGITNNDNNSADQFFKNNSSKQWKKNELSKHGGQKQHNEVTLSPPKPITQKHLRLDAQKQMMSNRCPRASTMRPPTPSRRTSSLGSTGRGRLPTRVKSSSSNRLDLQIDKAKLLMKRTNPLSFPPPTPSVTPLNSARTRSNVIARSSSKNVLKTHPRSSTTKNACFFGNNNGEDGYTTTKSPRHLMVPTNNSEMLENNDLVEALNNCLYNLVSTGKEGMRYVTIINETTRGKEDELQDFGLSEYVTVYAGELPYEKLDVEGTRKKSQNKENSKHAELKERKINTICDKNHTVLKNIKSNNKIQTNTRYDEEDDIKTSQNVWRFNKRSSSQGKSQSIDDLIYEREYFLRLCNNIRFYANPNFNQPWSVLSKIADRLSNEIASMIEEDFHIGVSKFVQDFLKNEGKI